MVGVVHIGAAGLCLCILLSVQGIRHGRMDDSESVERHENQTVHRRSTGYRSGWSQFTVGGEDQ